MALFGALIAAFVGFIFHQLYLHPLAKYPGPLLGRITRLYDLYHAYVGDKHILLYQLHQKYGTIVRFTPNSLSINDPAALRAIYAHGANVQKGVFYKCFRVAPNAISTLLATDKAQHARKRRVMGQAFSDQAVKGLEQYVLQHVQDLVDRIGVAVNRPGGEKQRWSKPLVSMFGSNPTEIIVNCFLQFRICKDGATGLFLTLWVIWSLARVSEHWVRNPKTEKVSDCSVERLDETMQSLPYLNFFTGTWRNGSLRFEAYIMIVTSTLHLANDKSWQGRRIKRWASQRLVDETYSPFFCMPKILTLEKAFRCLNYGMLI